WGNDPMTAATDGLWRRLSGPPPGRAQGVKTSTLDKNPAATKATRRVRPAGRAAGQDAVNRAAPHDYLEHAKDERSIRSSRSRSLNKCPPAGWALFFEGTAQR